MKRLTTKASLQKPYEDQIMTPLIFSYTSGHLPTFLVYSLTNCRTIPGRLHCFLPQSPDTVLARRYSACPISVVHHVNKRAAELEVEEVMGYVTCVHQGKWWVAQVLERDDENGEAKLSMLSPSGPSRWFSYPPTPITLCVPVADILTVVKPRTTTSSYALCQEESKAASRKLKQLEH